MSQSGFIAALLLAAFVLYLAAQNRLVTYAAVLWGPTAKPIPQPTTPVLSGAPGAGLTGIESTAGTAGGLLNFGDFGSILESAGPLLLP